MTRQAKRARSWIGCSRIWVRTFHCTSPRFIRISNCAIGPRTPPETLHAARAIALEAGLHYVYEGNIYSDGGNTSCPSCKTLLIRRSWHDMRKNSLKNGGCPKCGLAIPGRWASGTAHRAGIRIAKARAGVAERHGDLNL